MNQLARSSQYHCPNSQTKMHILTRKQWLPAPSRGAMHPNCTTGDYAAEWCTRLSRGSSGKKQRVWRRGLAHRLATVWCGCLRKFIVNGHGDIIVRRRDWEGRGGHGVVVVKSN